MNTDWYPAAKLSNAPWFQAAMEGDTDSILNQLEHGADIDVKNDWSLTALMMAVGCRRFGATETLIRRGADVHIKDRGDGWTALTWAVIVARGWEFDAPPWPTHSCAPDTRFMELLTGAGARLGLREAILLGDVEFARQLCDQNPSIDINGEAGYRFHHTFLMMAAELGSTEMVDFLIDRGADLEGIDDLGHTALCSAALAGRTLVVQQLIDRGANVNHDWPAETPLTLAEDYGQGTVASLLLARGAKR